MHCTDQAARQFLAYRWDFDVAGFHGYEPGHGPTIKPRTCQRCGRMLPDGDTRGNQNRKWCANRRHCKRAKA